MKVKHKQRQHKGDSREKDKKYETAQVTNREQHQNDRILSEIQNKA